MPQENRQFRLAARPTGAVDRSHFALVSEPVGVPGPGEVLVEVLYLSLDPAMRGWMNEGRSYIRPVGIGEVMRAGGVGRVAVSNVPELAVGSYVVGTTGVQEWAVLRGRDVLPVDPQRAPLPRYLGALGMTGMTAYFGLLDVGRPEPGQTVVVSGAAGAVGSVAGQIARIKGCRVVGIAGGPEKCRHLVEELRFDAAIDYRHEDVREALKTHCPQGIDVYFDNVGGDILDAALVRLARGARVVICGAISQYNATERRGPANYLSLLVNRASMTGMVVFDYAPRYGEAMREIAGWIASGELVAREQVVSGFESFPERLQMLFRGENLGKLVLAVGPRQGEGAAGSGGATAG
jgi:NADPH-dependent curcumin reductase CurA